MLTWFWFYLVYVLLYVLVYAGLYSAGVERHGLFFAGVMFGIVSFAIRTMISATS